MNVENKKFDEVYEFYENFINSSLLKHEKAKEEFDYRKTHTIKRICEVCKCSESIAIEYVNKKIETQKNKLKQSIDK